MSRRVHVIINPASGQDEPVLAILNREFARAGVKWGVSVTMKAGDAARMATEAVDRGVDCVVSYGGDGTVSEVAGSLRGRGVPLAILPGGTGNVVATELGLPDDLADAVRLIGDPDVEELEIDLLDVAGRSVLLRLGFGADARMIGRASREQKDRLGWLAYLHAAFTEVTEPETARYRLDVDGRIEELDALTVVVANIGRIGRGGFSFASEIDPQDGLLDVLVLRAADLDGFMAVGASILGLRGSGDRDAVEGNPFLHLTGREVRVEAAPSQRVHADGDPLGDTPITARVVPDALTVLVPPWPRP